MDLERNGATECPDCGTRTDNTSVGDVGCTACLLRVGLDSVPDSELEAVSPWAEHQFGIYHISRRDDGILWELGRGAMGITFRAIDTTLNRAVALKIIHTDIAAGTQARERFMRGARVAAALKHPNVATIYHFGLREETGQCFYAMELVEGETLEERVLRTGPLDAKTTIAIARQVSDALAEAAQHGLVHRDLKPSNLMLVGSDKGMPAEQPRGPAFPKVKVIDFGLAKAIAAEADPMSLTQGGFVGTPAFASPEQFSNAPLDVRSDIYSLGATLWFGLTGTTLFKGRSVEEIQNAQRSGEPPVEKLKTAHVPSRLRSLLKSMVSFEPAARPAPDELMRRLRPSRIYAPRRFALGLAALLLLIVLTTFWYLPRIRSTSSTAVRAIAPAKHLAGTSNPAAREAYLQGRDLWNKREIKYYRQAGTYFEKAITLDPDYAEAYSALADTYPLIADNDRLIERSEDYARARAAAKKALELDPTLAGPHAALALVAMNYEWDWETAGKEYKRAIELNPKYATAHHWYAEFLSTQGRFDEAVAEITRAHELDPDSAPITTDHGKILYFSRRYDEAIEALHAVLMSHPEFLVAHEWLGQIYTEKALYKEAIAEFKAGDAPQLTPWTISMIGRALTLAGRKEEAKQKLQELQTIRKSHEIEPDTLVPIYIGLGEKDEVFALLEKEYDVRSTGLTSLKVGPLYDTLRSDPRFLDLLRRVHFAP